MSTYLHFFHFVSQLWKLMISVLIKSLNLFWTTGLEIEYVLWKPWYRISIFTDHQLSCGKVMFSVVSTCQSFCPQWGPVLLLPMRNWNPPYRESPPPQAPPLDMGCHCTGIPGPRPWTWNFTVHDPLAPPLLVTFSGQNSRPMETCSPENLLC